MKKTTSILLALLFVAAVFANCKPKEEDDNTPVLALLLYANDQLSGNCATIVKQGTAYAANLSVVPKGGCKVSQTKAEAVASLETQRNSIVAFYTKAGSACDAVAASVTTTYNSFITNTNNTADATYAASAALQRAVSISNIVTESKNTLVVQGRTEAQIAATKPGNLNDLFFASAFQTAAGVPACATAVKALDQTSADALTSTPPTKIVSSACGYGTGASYTTSSGVTLPLATTKCATLNTEF
ncbi:hypothetical protein [Leptospira vanthielii]|nr:hypothetical protein [Leptospira vanthielii]